MVRIVTMLAVDGADNIDIVAEAVARNDEAVTRKARK